MSPKTINTFISSANRENNEPVHNFSVDFTDDLIKCNQDQYIRVNVISFDMINTMYNILNGKIEILNNGVLIGDTVIEVPTGNYSVYSLKKWLEEEETFKNNFSIKYNTAQNSFTISKTNLTWTDDVYIKCWFLGFNVSTLITFEGTTGSYINLVNYNKVILRTDSLNFDISCIENVRYTNTSNKLKFSNILFWTSKQDVEPFRNIAYTNSDGGNSFNMMLHDKTVNKMNLQLTNELGEFITDAPDYLLVLQFSIYDKEEWFKKTILEIAENVKQVFVMMLWLAENYLRII